ncbi:MAG: fatty acid desaturase [Solirubrobacteraceae bacterium]|nr:fatty acid desaturase [Solirubrobacteraceae bacterium]
MATQTTPPAPPPAREMTNRDKYANMFIVFSYPVLIIVIGALSWGSGFLDWTDVAIFALMYTWAGFGVTVGYHRLLTHGSFETKPWVRYMFAIAGSMCVQGAVIHWVADHRKHHAFSDQEGDPHSPHLHGGEGFSGAVKGLWHSHVGWLWEYHATSDYKRYARDLYEDPTMRRIHKAFPLLLLATFAVPFILGYVFTGFTLNGGLTALFWGGLVRVTLQQHITWCVNSVCHFFGKTRFDSGDHATNVWWVALASFGEGWHHNHHTFPRSAAHGLKKSEFDMSALLITGLEKVGLASNVVRIAPERQEAKLLKNKKPAAA